MLSSTCCLLLFPSLLRFVLKTGTAKATPSASWLSFFAMWIDAWTLTAIWPLAPRHCLNCCGAQAAVSRLCSACRGPSLRCQWMRVRVDFTVQATMVDEIKLGLFGMFLDDKHTDDANATLIAESIAVALHNRRISKDKQIPMDQTVGLFDATNKDSRSAPLMLGRVIGTKMSLFHARFSTAFLEGFGSYKRWKQLGGSQSGNTPVEITQLMRADGSASFDLNDRSQLIALFKVMDQFRFVMTAAAKHPQEKS